MQGFGLGLRKNGFTYDEKSSESLDPSSQTYCSNSRKVRAYILGRLESTSICCTKDNLCPVQVRYCKSTLKNETELGTFVIA